MRISVLTYLPDLYPGTLGASIFGRALKEGRWALDIINLHDFADNPHRRIDDAPFGGGAGMVLKADVVDCAVRHLTQQTPTLKPHLVYLSPRGRLFKQAIAQEWATNQSWLVLLCGRFEGVDQRVLDAWNFDEVSIGDYVLGGGDVAAMALGEAIVRLIPGVVGDSTSLQDESHAAGLLEYPHYTQPAVWQGRAVPEVLTSGHHQKIKEWRHQQSVEITKARRPDLGYS